MRAILLAAGRGVRLQQPEDQQLPKCLLRFGGMTLLERHLRVRRIQRRERRRVRQLERLVQRQPDRPRQRDLVLRQLVDR